MSVTFYATLFFPSSLQFIFDIGSFSSLKLNVLCHLTLFIRGIISHYGQSRDTALFKSLSSRLSSEILSQVTDADSYNIEITTQVSATNLPPTFSCF